MNRRLFRRSGFSLGVSAFVGFAMFACSSSSNGGAGTGDTSSVSGFIDTYCSYVASCCGAESRPSDGTQCRELLDFSGIKNYDPAKGRACIDAVKTASASDPTWCVATPQTTNAACDQATSSGGNGNVAPGGKCNSSSDCAASANSGDTVACQFPPISDSDGGSSVDEICVDEAHGKAGDSPCAGTITTNGDGSSSTLFNSTFDAGAASGPETFCFVSDGVSCSNNKCVALAQVGASCTGTQCVTGAHCDFTNETCAANAATGEGCEFDSDCVTGDYCDTSTKTCAAKAAQGAACTSSNQCTSGDCESSKCGAGFGAAFGLAFLCGGDGGT